MLATSTNVNETAAPKRSSFRSELQGLRALAVGLVLLYHLWPQHLSGGFVGVDVFFVVSGFLITGHLYRELTTSGTIALGKFWARRVMRLLPLAFTVLVASLIALVLFLPQTMWEMNMRQILGSLFYIQNWVLAADSVDYMAADNEPSLVQHYWSLSIEEQFYVLLPLILLGSYLLIRKIRKNKTVAGPKVQQLFIWVLGTFIVLSLIFSMMYTDYDAAQAYFVTPTRFWEFAAGGLLAMLPAASKLPVTVQNALGWVGIVAIIISAITYSAETPFPGYTAILPVVGAILFIRYGSHSPHTGVYWWASLRPGVRMGDWSYAIYLWHWPLIIVAAHQVETFTWYHKIMVIVLTLVLSAASQKLIEDPLRKAKRFKVPHRAFALMATTMAVIAAVTFAVPQLLTQEPTEGVAIERCQGADALLSDCEDTGTTGEPLVPAVHVQQEAEEPAYPECNIPAGDTDFERSGCSLGVSEDSAELKIAVIGDSHARSWLPMLDEAGARHNWNIQGYTKSGCTPIPLNYGDPDADESTQEEGEACRDFVVSMAEELEKDPELDVIIPATASTDRAFYDASGELSDEEVTNAIIDLWKRWEEAGKEVIVIGEVPSYGDLDGPTCVVSNPTELVEECSLPTDTLLSSRDRVLTDAASTGDAPVDLYDPVPGMCDDRRCYSMVGDLITRYDHHHLSFDFSRSFGPNFVDFVHQLDLETNN